MAVVSITSMQRLATTGLTAWATHSTVIRKLMAVLWVAQSAQLWLTFAWK